MKIQLKRSNVLEGGSAKTPTAAQMEYGELAVNYNSKDPVIFIKDSDDNIIRIIDTNNPVQPPSITPPTSPFNQVLEHPSELLELALLKKLVSLPYCLEQEL